MKKINSYTLLFTAVITLMAMSCQTVKKTSNQDKGVVIGAASGAVIGGVIGNNLLGC